MYVRLLSFALQGIEAIPVLVEVDVSPGLPAFEVVGLPDAAVREARERVRAAIRNSGADFPHHRITVNLAPAHIRKAGPGFDLAIALCILAAQGQVPLNSLDGLAVAGELSLDGAVRPVRGALAMAMAGRGQGVRLMVLPQANVAEALLVGLQAVGAENLAQVVDHLNGWHPLQPPAIPDDLPQGGTSIPDLAEVRGQVMAKRALEIAAAGGHNLIMIGPPGAGKSMLAQTLPGILPPLAGEEALEVTRIHSVAGTLVGGRLVRDRPYRRPHHCASRSALLGGGQPLRPGEVTLAHHGVLFLDELLEFGRDSLEGLRQPLEEGRVSLSRAHGTAAFPARPMLVAAANPCPCGYLGDQRRACTCPPASVAHYRARLSGPLLDRFDIQLFLPPVPYEDWAEAGVQSTESSAAVRDRVIAARERQRERLGPETPCNSQMTPGQTRRFAPLPQGGQGLMREAVEKLGLSMRAHDRILRVARTIADLAGRDRLLLSGLAEAIQYRAFDRSSPA